MNQSLKSLVTAATLLASASVMAQTAGSWLVRAGVTRLSPDVTSGCLSAPDFGDNGVGGALGCSRSDVSADTQLSGGVTYMYTNNISVDVPVALPFKHKIIGKGSLEGTGDLGEVRALPFTVFLQYRFLDANAKFRPYVGLGATYAYFFDEEGSGKLTALTNPGGTPTKVSVDAKFILTPQIGASWMVNDKWFVDVCLTKSKLSTVTKLSTGQHMNIDLDPATFTVAVGYKF
jgi:outer membrane protein